MFLIPFHGPADIAASWFTSRETGAPFGFEFIPQCTFRDFNFGPKSSLPRTEDRRGPPRPRSRSGSVGIAAPSRSTPGVRTTAGRTRRTALSYGSRSLRGTAETDVFLMRGFDTEAIRIVIPVVGDADDDDLKSFVAAINLGMRRHFAGKVDHIRSTIFQAQLDGMTTVRSLYLRLPSPAVGRICARSGSTRKPCGR